MEFQIEDENEDFEEYRTLDDEEDPAHETGVVFNDSEYQKLAAVPTFRPKETFGLNSHQVLIEENESQVEESEHSFKPEKKIELSNTGDYDEIPIVEWEKEDTHSNRQSGVSFNSNNSNKRSTRRSSHVIRRSKKFSHGE